MDIPNSALPSNDQTHRLIGKVTHKCVFLCGEAERTAQRCNKQLHYISLHDAVVTMGDRTHLHALRKL